HGVGAHEFGRQVAEYVEPFNAVAFVPMSYDGGACTGDQFEQENIRDSHMACQHRFDLVFGPHTIDHREGGVECKLIGTTRIKIEAQGMVLGRLPQTLEHRIYELQRAGPEHIGKSVLVTSFVGMDRVDYASCFPEILNVHNNAWRAPRGALSRFLDLGTFDWIWRRSLRQLVGECLSLCRFAFLRSPFCCFAHGRIDALGELSVVSHKL